MKKIHEGDLIAEDGVVYDFEEISGYVYLRENAKASFPVLTSVGGYVDLGENAKASFPKLTHKDTKEAKDISRRMLMESFNQSGHSFADNILSKIISKRGNVTRVVVCGKTKISYLVQDGDSWSHGKTLKEARESLIYKLSSRDTTEFKKWKLTDEVSKRDAIRAYRAITGACESGVRGWVESREIPEKLTIEKVIQMTEGSYGNDKLKEFFAVGGK